MGCWPSREQHDPSTEGQELLQRSHTQSSSGLRHPQAVPVPNLTRRGVLARSGARPTIPEHPDEVDDFIVSAQQASGAPKQPIYGVASSEAQASHTATAATQRDPRSTPQRPQRPNKGLFDDDSIGPADQGQKGTGQRSAPVKEARKPPASNRTSGVPGSHPRERFKDKPLSSLAPLDTTSSTPGEVSEHSAVTEIDPEAPVDLRGSREQLPVKYPPVPKPSPFPIASYGAPVTSSYRAPGMSTSSASATRPLPVAPRVTAPFTTGNAAYESGGESCSSSDGSELGHRGATRSRR